MTEILAQDRPAHSYAPVSEAPRSRPAFIKAVVPDYSRAVRDDFPILKFYQASPQDGVDSLLAGLREQTSEGIFRFACFLAGRESPHISQELKERTRVQVLQLLEQARRADPSNLPVTFMLGWKLCAKQGCSEAERVRGQSLIRQTADEGFKPAIQHIENSGPHFQYKATAYQDLHFVQQMSINLGFMPGP